MRSGVCDIEDVQIDSIIPMKTTQVQGENPFEMMLTTLSHHGEF